MGSKRGLLIALLAAVPCAAGAAAQAPALEGLDGLERTIRLDYASVVPLAEVFEAVGAVAGFTARFDCSVEERAVALHLPRMSVGEALAHLAETFDLEFAVTGPAELAVGGPARCRGQHDLAAYRVLEGLAARDVPVLASFQEVQLSQLLDAVGRASGFKAEVESSCSRLDVTLSEPQQSVQDLLAGLAAHYDLEYSVPAPDRLTVACLRRTRVSL